MKSSNIILFALVVFGLAGCSASSKNKHEYKYTVWLGSSAVAVGYDTDSYQKNGDMITFTNKEGKEITVPTCNVFKIERNEHRSEK